MKPILFFLFLFPAVLWSQEENLKPTLVDNTDPSRWIFISPGEQPGLRGDQYLFEEWQAATLTFRENIVKDGLLVNFNLESDELEIATTDGIKIVPKGFITSWKVKDHLFVSLFGSQDDCVDREKSYAEVLSENGDLVLLKIRNLEKRNPAYNEKLGIGDNNYRYIREDKLILLNAGKCLEIIGGSGKREKSLIQFLRNQQISKLVRENDLNLKEEADLVTLVETVAHNL